MTKSNVFKRILDISIILCIIVKSLQLAIRVYDIFLLTFSKVESAGFLRQIHFLIKVLKVETYVSYSTLIPFALLFSVWMFINYKAATKRSSNKLSYRPIWALFCLIIPVFNFFAPYIILKEIWKVMNSDLSREKLGEFLIKTWWFLTIVLFIYSRFINSKIQHSGNFNDLLTLQYYSAVLYLLSVHYFLVLRKMVKMVNG